MRRTQYFHYLLIFQVSLLVLSKSTFAQLTFPSSYIKIPSSGLTLYFEYNYKNESITMGLEMDQVVDYFAVGFADEGNYGMKVFDIVAFVFIPNNDTSGTYTVQVLDAYSTRNKRPPNDIDLGGTNDYILLDSYVVPGKSQVLFTRAWNTGDQYDYTFDPIQTKKSLIMDWAWMNRGKYNMTYHQNNRGTVITTMYNGFQGEAEVYDLPGLLSPSNVVTMHGYLMLFAWAILVEIAIQFGRYRKYYKHYITIHMILNLALYIMTMVSTGFVLYIKWGSVKSRPQVMHFYLGVIIVVLSTVQATLGLMLRKNIVGSGITEMISPLGRFHFTSGILLYVITKAQLALGLYIYKPDFVGYLLGFYVVILILRVVQERFYRARGDIGLHEALIEKENSVEGKHQKLLELLTPVSEILKDPELQDIKWAILDNKVFSLDNITHPGGNFILQHIRGREISRFVYGAYGIEFLAGPTQHLHSKETLMIIEKNFIGIINDSQKVVYPIVDEACISLEDFSLPLIEPTTNQTSLIMRKRSTSRDRPTLGHSSRTWTLDKKTILTSHTSKFEFRCDEYNINPVTKDIRHLGRHLKVSHVSEPKIRLYTLVLSQTAYRIKKRELLWQRFKGQIGDVGQYMGPPFSQTLPLIIKRYDIEDLNTFSKFIHSKKINDNGFIIDGPYGTGLGLTPESSGLHYIFTGGTGIYPFLDLFDYLLEGVLEYGDLPNIFRNGFKLHVFASFAQIDDFVGLEICEKIVEVCTQKGIKDAFKLTLKAPDVKKSELYAVTNEMFDDVFVERNVVRNCQKVYVCGPPVFNHQVPMSLELMGVQKEKIVIV